MKEEVLTRTSQPASRRCAVTAVATRQGSARCHQRSAGGLGQYPGRDGSDRHRFVGQLRKGERWRNECSRGGRVGSCRSMKVSFRGYTVRA